MLRSVVHPQTFSPLSIFSGLPRDIWGIILRSLLPYTRYSAKLVCRRWYELIWESSPYKLSLNRSLDDLTGTAIISATKVRKGLSKRLPQIPDAWYSRTKLLKYYRYGELHIEDHTPGLIDKLIGLEEVVLRSPTSDLLEDFARAFHGGALQRLTHLDMYHCRSADFSPLATLSTLRSCVLAALPMPAAIVPLLQLPHLSSLDLSSCGLLKEDAVAPLSQLRAQLTYLDVMGVSPCHSLPHLSALTALRTLRMHFAVSPLSHTDIVSTFPWLSALTNLRVLDCFSFRLRKDASLPLLPFLHTLRFDIEPNQITHLTTLRHLATPDIREQCSMSLGSAQCLNESLTGLVSLSLALSEGVPISALSDLTNLRSLYVQTYYDLKHDFSFPRFPLLESLVANVVPEQISHLSTIRYLHMSTFCMPDATLSTASLQCLVRALPWLSSLRICAQRDVPLSTLQPLTALRTLYFFFERDWKKDIRPLSCSDVKALLAMPSLERLEVDTIEPKARAMLEKNGLDVRSNH